MNARRVKFPVMAALKEKFPNAQLDGIDGQRLEEALDGVDRKRSAGTAVDTLPTTGQIKRQLETITELLRSLKYELGLPVDDGEQPDKPRGEFYALNYALDRAREKAAELDRAARNENEAVLTRWRQEEGKRQENWVPADETETYMPLPQPIQLRTNHCASLDLFIANVAIAFRVFQEANLDPRNAETDEPEQPKGNRPRISATNRIVADLKRVHAEQIGNAIPRSAFIEWALTKYFGEKPLSKATIRKRLSRGAGLRG